MNFVIKSMIVQHHLQLISVKYMPRVLAEREREDMHIDAPKVKGKR